MVHQRIYCCVITSISYYYAGPAPAIPRLGIDPYEWGTICDHGDVRSGTATSFPQELGMVCSYNVAMQVYHAQCWCLGHKFQLRFGIQGH